MARFDTMSLAPKFRLEDDCPRTARDSQESAVRKPPLAAVSVTVTFASNDVAPAGACGTGTPFNDVVEARPPRRHVPATSQRSPLRVSRTRVGVTSVKRPDAGPATREGTKNPCASTITCIECELYMQNRPRGSSGTTARLATVPPLPTLPFDQPRSPETATSHRSAVTKASVFAPVRVMFTNAAVAPAGACNTMGVRQPAWGRSAHAQVRTVVVPSTWLLQ